MLTLHFLSSSFLKLVMHSVVQVQRPQDCFQADTKRPSAPTQHTALVLLCLSSP